MEGSTEEFILAYLHELLLEGSHSFPRKQTQIVIDMQEVYGVLSGSTIEGNEGK